MVTGIERRIFRCDCSLNINISYTITLVAVRLGKAWRKQHFDKWLPNVWHLTVCDRLSHDTV